jgi:hypothetical protein
MKVTRPPRSSAAIVDPRAVISKKRSRRFTLRTLRDDGRQDGTAVTGIVTVPWHAPLSMVVWKVPASDPSLCGVYVVTEVAGS